MNTDFIADITNGETADHADGRRFHRRYRNIAGL